MLVERDDVVVQLRELDDRLEHVLLRNAAGRVLRLRDVGDLAQELDAREMNVNRLTRDEQGCVRLFDLVDDLASANRDVRLREHNVPFRHGHSQETLAAAGQLLAEHEHVHVRVGRVERVDGPLPDRCLRRGRVEAVLLIRPLSCDGNLLS